MKNKFEHQTKKLQSSTNNWPDPELTLSHQGVSQEFLSFGAGVWGPTLKAPHGSAQKVPNGVRGKAPENFGYLALTCFFYKQLDF